MKFFHLSVRLTNEKPDAFVCPFDKPIKLLYFRSFVVSVLFPRFHFKVIRKSLYRCLHLAFPFRCLQKFPVSFLKCDIAIPSIHCAVVASIIEHRDANLSVMKFLKCLVSCATEKVRLKDFTSFSCLFVPVNTLVLIIGVYSKNP